MLFPLDAESFLQILVEKSLVERAETIILTVLSCILSIDCVPRALAINYLPKIQRLCLLV